VSNRVAFATCAFRHVSYRYRRSLSAAALLQGATDFVHTLACIEKLLNHLIDAEDQASEAVSGFQFCGSNSV
jgi:hypothetical protein